MPPPGQATVLHVLVAEASPVQDPPHDSDRVFTRFLVWVPPSHVLEQAPHFPHDPHLQSTGQHLLQEPVPKLTE